jgi:hypothetical protein
MKSLLRAVFVLLVAVTGAWPVTAAGQTASDANIAAAQRPITEAQLRMYLEESMLLQITQAQIQSGLDQNHQTMTPWIPEKIWQLVKDKTAAIDLVKVLLPVYQKYYTEDDGNAISLMFDGPTGHALAVAASPPGTVPADNAEPVGNPAELSRKRTAELTPEQLAALQRMRAATRVKTLDGFKIEEDQNEALGKMMDAVSHTVLIAHQRELAAARQAYNKQQH